MLKLKKILILLIYNQSNLLNGLTNRWVILSTSNGLMMLREEISLILLNILCFLGFLLQTRKSKNYNKKYTEIFWKIWEVMVLKREFSIFYKNTHLITNKNFLMSIILVHIILQVPLFLIIWSESDHFQSDQWLYKVENLTVLTEFLAVMLAHGTMLPIHQLISENWYLKFILCLKCLLTWIIMILDSLRTSSESIMYNYQNGQTKILINLLLKFEENSKVLMCLKI